METGKGGMIAGGVGAEEVIAGGVIAGGHPATTEAGLEILRRGGNAADAAVAACCTAVAAEAALTGLGAGGFALVRHPDSESELIDFFVTAPGRGGPHPDLSTLLLPPPPCSRRQRRRCGRCRLLHGGGGRSSVDRSGCGRLRTRQAP